MTLYVINDVCEEHEQHLVMFHVTCNVLPSPIECARMQPNPVEVLNLDKDSTTLSNRNRTPPICNKNKFSKLIICTINLIYSRIYMQHQTSENTHTKDTNMTTLSLPVSLPDRLRFITWQYWPHQVMGPTQPPIQWVPGALPQGYVAWVWNWPLNSIQHWSQEWWSYTSTPPTSSWHGAPRLYSVQCTLQWNRYISETVQNRTSVHIHFLFRMTDTVTSLNIDLSSWDTLYIQGRSIRHTRHGYTQIWTVDKSETWVCMYV
jgi:hypothetical protein